MKIATLFADDNEAVSPVIGVILMVAITVILAAVIGTFVLGQADQLNENAPTTDFDFESQGDSTYNILHAGGNDFQSSNVEIQYVDSGSTQQSATWEALNDDGDSNANTVSAGGVADTNAMDGDMGNVTSVDRPNAGSTIRVTWTSAEGGSSSTIGTYDVPA